MDQHVADYAPTSDLLLRLRGVRKEYRQGTTIVRALNNVSLDIHRGELMAVIGPSGSGKTTLLNMIGGIERPTDGSILWYGEQEKPIDLAHAPDRMLTVYRRRRIGFVFQFFNLIPTLTAIENVELVASMAEDAIDPMQALEMVGLADRADHFPSQLSGGEQQRVAIARAFVRRPRLILCDEPTGALDTKTGRQVLELLLDLNRRSGISIVIVTHNPEVARAARRRIYLEDGAIKREETD